MSSTKLDAGQAQALRSHERSLLLVVLRGTADLVGSEARPVAQGDVICVPRGCDYGFSGVGPEGFHAVAVEFDDEESAAPAARVEEEASLEGLMAHHARRLDQFLGSRFFSIVRDVKLEGAKQQVFLDCIQVISDVFQTIMFSRQATCRDQPFESVFLSHLLEEIGHNQLLAAKRGRRRISDPVLQAAANWFSYQMFVLDNVEKAVLVHLVLESTGHRFHTLAKERFHEDVGNEYHDVHAENDEHHTEMGIELLEGHLPATYERLHRILDDGWDMFDTLLSRIVALVDACDDEPASRS